MSQTANRQFRFGGETPPEHNKPLMLLLNLALGPGWPIDNTPNPSVMEVDYVRVHAETESKQEG